MREGGIEKTIGAEGAGRLAGVLGQCGLLVHLNVCYNSIGDDGAGRLVVVLGECRSDACSSGS